MEQTIFRDQRFGEELVLRATPTKSGVFLNISEPLSVEEKIQYLYSVLRELELIIKAPSLSKELRELFQ